MNQLKKLVSIEEIKVLKARYFRAVDTKDWPLLEQVFAEDVVCDYRGWATDTSTGVVHAPEITEAPVVGRAAIVALFRRGLVGIVSAHQGYLPEINIIDENNATGLWAMYDALRLPPGRNPNEIFGFGHYLEMYRKHSGRWRIQTLRLIRLRVDTVTNAPVRPAPTRRKTSPKTSPVRH